MTCWRRLREWQEAGVWTRLHECSASRSPRAAGEIAHCRGLRWSAQSHPGSKRGARRPGRARSTGGRAGVKHHLIVDARGRAVGRRQSPAATVTTSPRCCRYWTRSLLIRGGVGRPWRRPRMLYADRGYDTITLNGAPRVAAASVFASPAARPATARGGGAAGRLSRPSRCCTAIAWSATCYDRTIETHQAFVGLACCLICWRRLSSRTSLAVP